MESISKETLLQAITILGDLEVDGDEIDKQISNLVTDPITVRRLVVWLPEAFAMCFISHSWDINLPKLFSVKKKNGEWVQFEFDREPIFTASLEMAKQMYDNDPKGVLQVSFRSSMMQAVNSALKSGANIEGSTIGGPALDLPAEIYLSPPPKSFLRRLFQ